MKFWLVTRVFGFRSVGRQCRNRHWWPIGICFSERLETTARCQRCWRSAFDSLRVASFRDVQFIRELLWWGRLTRELDFPLLSPYAASKHALVGLLSSLRQELGPQDANYVARAWRNPHSFVGEGRADVASNI